MESPNSRAEEMLRRRWRFVLAALFAAALLARLPNISDYLDVDSADYVHAARMGYLVNAFDLGSQPVGGFLAAGFRSSVLKEEVHLWRDNMAAGDVAAFRHYHPALFFYSLGAWMGLFGSSNAALMLFPTLLGALLAPLLAWAWRLLFPNQSGFVGVFAGAFAAVDPLLSHTGKFVTYHMPFAVLAFLALVVLARAVRDQNTRDFYVFAGLLGAAFATLEYALILAGAALVTLVLIGNPWMRLDRRGLMLSAHLFGALLLCLAVFTILWPAGVLKLSALKGYALLGAMSQRTTWEAPPTLVLRDFMTESPVMMLFFAVGIALAGYHVVSGRAQGWLLPLALFPGLIVLLNLGNAVAKPTYLAITLPYLMLLAGWALWAVTARAGRRQVLVCLVVVAVGAAVNAPGLARAGRHSLYFWPQAIACIEGRAAPGDEVLVSNNLESSTLAHYVPKVEVEAGFGWPAAVKEVTEKVQRGDYRLLLLIGYPEKRAENDMRRPLADLPYYGIVNEKYQRVQVLKRGPGDVIVEIYQRKAS